MFLPESQRNKFVNELHAKIDGIMFVLKQHENKWGNKGNPFSLTWFTVYKYNEQWREKYVVVTFSRYFSFLAKFRRVLYLQGMPVDSACFMNFHQKSDRERGYNSQLSSSAFQYNRIVHIIYAFAFLVDIN